MNVVYEHLKAFFKGDEGLIVTTFDIKKGLYSKKGTNLGSIIPSD